MGRIRGSDLALLWLWCRLAATTLIQLLAWEPPYAAGAELKRQKKKKKVFIYTVFRRRHKLIIHSPSSSPLPYVLLGWSEQRPNQNPQVIAFYFKATWPNEDSWSSFSLQGTEKLAMRVKYKDAHWNRNKKKMSFILAYITYFEAWVSCPTCDYFAA